MQVADRPPNRDGNPERFLAPPGKYTFYKPTADRRSLICRVEKLVCAYIRRSDLDILTGPSAFGHRHTPRRIVLVNR
jgi:hypothetical protein